MTILNLGCNEIGKEGVQFLSEAIKLNSSLTSLNLHVNLFGNEGAQFISEAIKVNSSLTELDIQLTSIGKSGVQFISEALKHNSSLTDIAIHIDDFVGKEELISSVNERLLFNYNRKNEVNQKDRTIKYSSELTQQTPNPRPNFNTQEKLQPSNLPLQKSSRLKEEIPTNQQEQVKQIPFQRPITLLEQPQIPTKQPTINGNQEVSPFQKQEEVKQVESQSNTYIDQLTSWFNSLTLREDEKNHYLKLFLDQGLDDLSIIVDLEEKEFNDLFSTTISFGHRKKIWNSILQLKDKNSQPKQEHTTRSDRRNESPTSNSQPGSNFLKFIPTAPTDKQSIINSLNQWSSLHPLDSSTLIQNEINYRSENLSKSLNINEETSLALTLLWLYTLEGWPYKRMNELLRSDSINIQYLAPLMNMLIHSSDILQHDSNYFYHGVVYRSTRLSEKNLSFYQVNTRFIWRAFTSSTTTMEPSGKFGDILFQITIPEKFKKFAINVQLVSDYPDEEEILLLPNVGYIVEAVESTTSPNVYRCIIKITVSWVCFT
uniref:NAD(P)(+)--arginine ADP-ribosyltransferase n=1 Tax=Arcella intermedia TaxID=1963864 RepID=A0A6B2KZS0_9EUKA